MKVYITAKTMSFPVYQWLSKLSFHQNELQATSEQTAGHTPGRVM